MGTIAALYIDMITKVKISVNQSGENMFAMPDHDGDLETKDGTLRLRFKSTLRWQVAGGHMSQTRSILY